MVLRRGPLGDRAWYHAGRIRNGVLSRRYLHARTVRRLHLPRVRKLRTKKKNAVEQRLKRKGLTLKGEPRFILIIVFVKREENNKKRRISIDDNNLQNIKDEIKEAMQKAEQ